MECVYRETNLRIREKIVISNTYTTEGETRWNSIDTNNYIPEGRI